MTSLIFGSIYLGHHVIVGHRREKRRVKNYERWEGLRDEYDEQKRTQRETRSLDLQRTGQYDTGYEERPILTLRDQQEADDARTSWRPQESFTPLPTGSVNGQQQQPTGSIYQPPRGRPHSMDVSQMRAVSDSNGYNANSTTGLGIQQPTRHSQLSMRPLPAQQTGAWDDALPQPPRISRQFFDESFNSSSPNLGVNRASSLREYGSRRPASSMTPRSPYAGSSESLSVPKRNTSSRSPSIPEERVHHVEPIENETPGGQMAALIEGIGNTNIHASAASSQRYVSAPVPQSVPVAASTSRPPPTSSNPALIPPPNVNRNARDGEQDMEEWWKQKGTGGETNMAEWWQQHPNAALPAPLTGPPAIRPPVTQGARGTCKNGGNDRRGFSGVEGRT